MSLCNLLPTILAPLLLSTVLLVPYLYISREPQADLFLSNLLARQETPICGSFCRFSLCSANSTLTRLDPAPYVILGPPLLPSNRFICRRDIYDPRVTVLSTGDPEISVSSTQFTALSRWRPQRLSPAFPRNFLRTAVTRPGSRGLYGVTSATPRGNQWGFLHNQCFILPIQRYRYERAGGRYETVDATGERDACVAFRTRAPRMHVQLTWESDGDGDLVVQEGAGDRPGMRWGPQGEAVDFMAPRSEAGGRLLGDNGKETCSDGDFPGYTENVVYFPGDEVPTGNWMAEAWQAGECRRNQGQTRWSLRIVRDGVERMSRRGLARATGLYQKVGVVRFTVS